jgi:hypothetical protein
VRPAIRLDSQHEILAKEIHDVLVDWALPVEVVSANLPLFQLVPEKHFSQGHFPPSLAGVFFELRVVRNDGPPHEGER